ncbi:hypothetical protein GDO81_015106 [Engystomops pustulosus]|uniref:Uncharacterized protein n=1 Tax=Engystomops pustulosus TaxID=76066 RepID=A0AAV7APR3_ENGPU|nr:hypothetical protein GDO81_015106 [Engystomops pustulosus]
MQEADDEGAPKLPSQGICTPLTLSTAEVATYCRCGEGASAPQISHFPLLLYTYSWWPLLPHLSPASWNLMIPDPALTHELSGWGTLLLDFRHPEDEIS